METETKKIGQPRDIGKPLFPLPKRTHCTCAKCSRNLTSRLTCKVHTSGTHMTLPLPLWHTTCKCDVIHKTGSTWRIATAPEQKRTTAIGNNAQKFGENWTTVLCCFVGFLFFPVPSQEIGWEEHIRNDLFCVEWDVKPCSIPIPEICPRANTQIQTKTDRRTRSSNTPLP